MAHVEIKRFLKKIREKNLVNGEYHVECQNISAKLRDDSLKIKRCHVDLKKEFGDAGLQGRIGKTNT